MRAIYTAGVFDLLHRGHLNLLWESRQMGDVLVVGVVSDVGCEAYKGHRPVESTRKRMDTLRRLPFVDVVVPQATTDPSENLRRFRPDVMTHGDDWDELLVGQETVRALGIEWALIPYTPDISSTALREGRVPA